MDNINIKNPNAMKENSIRNIKKGVPRTPLFIFYRAFPLGRTSSGNTNRSPG